MSWSQAPWSEGAWAGGVIPNTTPPGQVLPPPVPGATAQYVQAIQQGSYPWSLGGWAGGANLQAVTLGGIVVAPDPQDGVANVSAWWPFASTMQVVRITPDGARTPVRGAYPITVSTSTRTNQCQNPCAAAGLNGYVPGAGSPTLSAITRTDIPSTTAWRATIAAAGSDEVVVPVALNASQPVTIGADLRFSSRPATVTITVGWVNAVGGAVASSVVTLTGDQVNAAVSQFGRPVILVQPTAGAAQCSTLKITATGMLAGGTMDGSRITVEQAITDGSPFDGNTLGGTWTGVANLSTSILAPVMTVQDGECPLDVPVLYQVYNPALIGGSAAATPVILDSSGDIGWLTHPASPDSPVACYPTVAPSPVRALQQVILPIIGRRFPVAVSAAVRQAPRGAHSIYTDTFTQRDALLELLADGQPLLLRAPAAFGYGYSQWLAFADITEDPGGRPAYMQGRTLAGNYQEVDAPAGLNLLGG